MTSPAEFYGFAIALVVMGYGFGRCIEFGCWKAYCITHPQVVLMDGDTRHLEFTRKKVEKGNEVKHGKGDDEARYILEGAGRHTSNRGSTWLLHKRHGWNLHAAPDSASVALDKGLQVLALHNPQSYAVFSRMNMTRKTLQSQDEKPAWYEAFAGPVVVLAFIMAVLMAVGVYYLYRVYEATNGGGA